jgi:hypothetical protein
MWDVTRARQPMEDPRLIHAPLGNQEMQVRVEVDLTHSSLRLAWQEKQKPRVLQENVNALLKSPPRK